MTDATTSDHVHDHDSPKNLPAEVMPPTPPTPSDRAEIVAEKIGAILKQYRCALAPILNVENVGRDPIGKVIVTAGFVVQPL